MNINDAFGNYLKKEDITRPTIVTISHVEMEDINNEGKTESRPVLYFTGATKGLVINKTNAGTLTALLGAETDDWQGKRITLYVDPTVMFGGRKQGGLRVRGAGGPVRAQGTTAARRPSPAAPMPDDEPDYGSEPPEDDVPF